MSQIIGPFTVEDDNLLGQCQAVASLIPAAIANADPPGTSHIWSSQRFGAPAWAYGYTPNSTNSWCNPARHVVAHEYAHQWWNRHGRQVGGNAALRGLVDHPELLGKIENSHFTNRLSEAYAHAFAAAIGAPDGVREGFYRVKIPPANYGALLALMGKALAVATRPTHTYLRAGRIALRTEPLVQAQVGTWAESGSEIQATDGRSGGLYTVRTPDGTGLQSRLWLAVSALNGSRLDPPLWTAELAWEPIPAAPPSPPTSPVP